MRRLFLAAFVLGDHFAASAGPRDIAATAFPSVVMIVTEDTKGQPLAIGSGFFVKQNVIASNAHVIEDAASGYAKLVGQKKRFDLQGIVAIDARHDLVLLAVADANALPLKLGISGQVAVGDHVYSVGNPKGLEGTFADGIISGVREVGADKILQITAPISPGSSGGPILDESGAVIGVAAATYKGGQNLNFAIPISHVTNLMTNTGALAPFSTKKAEPKQSSYLSALGENSRRGVELASFSWGAAYEAKGTYHKLDFVFRNKLRDPLTNVRALIIASDSDGNPCDFVEVTWPEARAGWADSYPVLPPGLAKPSDTAFPDKTFSLVGPNPSKSLEIRVLGFDIVEGKH